MLLGCSAGTLFFWLNDPSLVAVSAGVVAFGPIAGWLVAKAGFGIKGPRFKAKH
jgi:hypothetical protein